MLKSLYRYSTSILHILGSGNGRYLTIDYRRYGVSRKNSSEIPEYSALDLDGALKNAIDWLIHAQSAMQDDGIGYYSIASGWTTSYPETTGYIIPTLLDYAGAFNDENARDAAVKSAKWLLKIQHPGGGWQGGRMSDNKPAVVFNTAQVIRGMIRMYRLTGETVYLDAALRAGHWLAKIQRPDGTWVEHALMGRPRVYDSYVDAPMLELFNITNEKALKIAAEKNLRWIVDTQLHENGWFADCDNTIKHNDRPILHTIAYTLDGMIDASSFLNDSEYAEKASLAAKVLRDKFLEQGYLNGRFDANWMGSEYMICTGGAQMAIVWMKLALNNEDEKWLMAARQMIQLLSYIQKRPFEESKDTLGAIQGSFPIWGKYEPFTYPNWATKYFADALMIQRTFPK